MDCPIADCRNRGKPSETFIQFADYFAKDIGAISYPKVFDYVIAELEYYNEVRKRTGGYFQMGSSDYTFYGNMAVPEDLKLRFKKAADALEDSLIDKKNWRLVMVEFSIWLTHIFTAFIIESPQLFQKMKEWESLVSILVWLNGFLLQSLTLRSTQLKANF